MTSAGQTLHKGQGSIRPTPSPQIATISDAIPTSWGDAPGFLEDSRRVPARAARPAGRARARDPATPENPARGVTRPSGAGQNPANTCSLAHGNDPYPPPPGGGGGSPRARGPLRSRDPQVTPYRARHPHSSPNHPPPFLELSCDFLESSRMALCRGLSTFLSLFPFKSMYPYFAKHTHRPRYQITHTHPPPL